MTYLGWLFAVLFCLAWLCTEYQRRQLERLNRAYEQHMRNKLVPYEKIWADMETLAKHFPDHSFKLQGYKARVIVKKSEAHKLIKLKVVEE